MKVGKSEIKSTNSTNALLGAAENGPPQLIDTRPRHGPSMIHMIAVDANYHESYSSRSEAFQRNPKASKASTRSVVMRDRWPC